MEDVKISVQTHRDGVTLGLVQQLAGDADSFKRRHTETGKLEQKHLFERKCDPGL